MFPFVFDPRPTSALFNSTRRSTRSSRGTNIPSEIQDSFPPPPSSYPTTTPPRYATRSRSSSSGSGNSGNSLRNPYNFVQPKTSYSPKKRSPSTTSSSSSSTKSKSRLAAINSQYDCQYGEWDGHATAEEIRNAAADISFTDPSVSPGSGRSSTSSTTSDNDSTSSSSKRKLRHRVKDKLLGRKRLGSSNSSDDGDDEDRLMDDEGQ